MRAMNDNDIANCRCLHSATSAILLYLENGTINHPAAIAPRITQCN